MDNWKTKYLELMAYGAHAHAHALSASGAPGMPVCSPLEPSGDSAPSRDNWCLLGNSLIPPAGTGLGLLSKSTAPLLAHSRSSVNVDGAETSGPRRPQRAGSAAASPRLTPSPCPPCSSVAPAGPPPSALSPAPPEFRSLLRHITRHIVTFLDILFPHSFSQQK